MSTNSNVDTVYLTIGHHTIMSENENNIANKMFLGSYMPIVDIDQYIQSLPININMVKYYLIFKLGLLHSASLNYSLKALKNRNEYYNYLFLGNYLAKQGNNLTEETINSTIERHYKDRTPDINNIATVSLDKIIALCKESEKELIILITPINKKYSKQIPKEVKQTFRKLLTDLQQNNTEVYDFSSLQMPDENFGDGDHLNEVGATRFTQKIIRMNNRKQKKPSRDG